MIRTLSTTVLGLVAAAGLLVGVAHADPSKPTAEALEKGRSLYAVNCVVCHGEKGAGDGAGAAALEPKPRNFITEKFKNGDSPAAVFKSITDGVPGTAMIPYGHLSDDDRWAVTHFVLSLAKAAPAKAKAPPAKKPPAKSPPAKNKTPVPNE